MIEPMPIPRGEQRADLQAAGLVEKVCINSAWKETEVVREISSLFASCFGLNKDNTFPFTSGKT